MRLRLGGFWAAGGRVAISLAMLVLLGGCASLAVNPCDSVADRDGKYLGRFFLGVSTLGLSEVTIQQEEVRQAHQVAAQGGCPAPEGVRVVSASRAASSPSVAVGTLVNGTPWALAVYLNQDPDARGAAPLTILFPDGDIRLGFQSGRHELVARPTGSGDLPRTTWRREVEIDSRIRGFKLEFNRSDFH